MLSIIKCVIVLISLPIIQSDERLSMKFSQLVEHVSKKAIGPHVKHLIVEIMVTDEDDEDVEVSPLRFESYKFLSDIVKLRSHSLWFAFNDLNILISELPSST